MRSLISIAVAVVAVLAATATLASAAEAPTCLSSCITEYPAPIPAVYNGPFGIARGLGDDMWFGDQDTVDRAAHALSVSRDFFAEHVLPELRVIRRGRLVLIPMSELELWADRNAARTLEVYGP
jgi:hypothetical protein